jgi:hypothetical protein
MQSSWTWTSLLHWLGVALLLANGCLAGWLACAVATLLPILLLQDQLTQSGYLFVCALAGCLCWLGASGRSERLDEALPRTVRTLTVLVYALAALHKLNRDFFNPAVSCANGGLVVLANGAADWLPPSIAESFVSPSWPIVFVVIELSLPVLLLLRPAIGVTVACVFHVPLTIIFAPGFVFTMMSGWLCFFSTAELRAMGRILRRRWKHIVIAAAIPATLSRALLFSGRWDSDPDWCLKEAILWCVLAWLIETLTTRHCRATFQGRGAWLEQATSRVHWAVAALFLVNGLTPYAGLQFHRTGAMLSNLRIDDGCNNSFLFPAAPDPYVRIDRIDFANGRAVDGLAERITTRLWGPEALHRARLYWCRIHDEPLLVEGTYRGERFSYPDFCASWTRPPLSGMRRFQANLQRHCPQRCIH